MSSKRDKRGLAELALACAATALVVWLPVYAYLLLWGDVANYASPVEWVLAPVLGVHVAYAIWRLTGTIRAYRAAGASYRMSRRGLWGCALLVGVLGGVTFAMNSPTALYLADQFGPYSYTVDDPATSRVVAWHVKWPASFKFRYWPASNPEAAESVTTPTARQHEVFLEGLSPDAEYRFQIVGFSDSTFRFKTAPNDTRPFTFLVYGDTRGGPSEPSRLGELAANASAYLGGGYDFVINTGDIAYSSWDLSGWVQFFRDVQPPGDDRVRPYYVSIGNHEWGLDQGRNFEYFFKYKPDRYYSFNWSNVHVAVVDNYDDWLANVGKPVGSVITDEQLAWLDADLARNAGKRWLVVAFHVPPYSTGDYGYNVHVQRQLGPVLEKYGVHVVLTGHDHHYESFLVNGTYYFVTGGGGSPLDYYIVGEGGWRGLVHNASEQPFFDDYATTHYQLYGELAFHFLTFDVNGSTMTINAVRGDGSLMQELVLTEAGL
ncbi:MAG: hypothetical protein Kow0069_35800 [Promethearchaeota archaeon]